jgi:hypothetical protein
MGSISDYDALELSHGRGPENLYIRNGITATAGGGQANAFQLQADINEITTVASIGDSVMLPKVNRAGQAVMVINRAANAVQVFGYSGDTINDVATATGVSQMGGSVVIYVSTSGGKWYTTGLGVGYVGSFEVYSIKDGIIAHAGGGQAGALADANAQLTAMNNRIATCATLADSVALPAAKPGMNIYVANDGAASSTVYPQTGESINQLAANAGFAVANAKGATFFCIVAGKWHAILSA